MKIHILEDHIVNRIAAGEVVERPASVVHELVDNAVDAGAKEISIWLESGGRNLIKVVDDGCGMAHDDAMLAFERHATSKLKTDKDLNTIHSMGFRGEALSSIAAVAKVSLITRNAEESVAAEIVFHGGRLKDVSQSAGPVGTQIEVRNLFFNTPARKKFLKQPKTEERRVKLWVRNSALAHPHIRYRLYADEREILNLPRKNSSLERAKALFQGSFVSFEKKLEHCEAVAMIAHPSLAQVDAASFIILVNGRVVSDRMLVRAVKEGFDSTLKEREYPVGYLALTVPPAEVDVNVHPQKSEVRFRESNAIFATVRDFVLAAVKDFRSPMKPFMTRQTPGRVEVESEPFNFQARDTLSRDGEGVAVNSYSHLVEDQAGSDMSRLGVSQADTVQGDFEFSALRYVGQILECYLVCELDRTLYVVDMHAAHERYNYNYIRNSFSEQNVAVQQLLVPITVELTEEGVQNCVEHQELFSQFGFEVEPFGEHVLLVRSVPTMLVEKSIAALIKEVAALSYDEGAEGKFKEVIDHVAARVACHASIRSGKRMEREEVYALFAALDCSAFSAACPHGRPVIVSFSAVDVERWFGRDR
ncbi:DNA mismatch repair endonuclease MutL [Oligoflexia bacterium]|nr:DNA mismatch repair endonuclease MutL [Oligoflexia bacterium]